MPIAIKAVLWHPGMPGLPLEVQDWQMYELPSVDAHYWHDRTGYRVERIERDDDETRVHLVRDPDWEEAMCAPLPDNYRVDGGRRNDDGSWHFHVIGPTGRLLADGWAFAADCETAIRGAVAGAVAQIQRERRRG